MEPITAAERAWAMGEQEEDDDDVALRFFTTPGKEERLRSVFREVRGQTVGAWVLEDPEERMDGGSVWFNGVEVVRRVTPEERKLISLGVDPWAGEAAAD